MNSVIDPFDPSTPGYDAALGFRPCRREKCETIQLHPWHRLEERARRTRAWKRYEASFLARARAIRASRVPRPWEQVKLAERLDQDTARLEAIGVRPIRELTTESGEVITMEWRCPDCDGRGWHMGDGFVESCAECRGRAVIQRSRAQMVILLARLGRI